MRKSGLTIVLLLAAVTAFSVTTLIQGDVITQYDTKQNFVAGSTDYAVSEVFDGNAFAGKYCVVTAIAADSTTNTAATAAKYVIATLQGSNSQAANWVDVGMPMLWKQLVLVVNSTKEGGNNKGQSDSFVLDLTKFNMPYLRIKYDVYVGGTRKTDVTTGGAMKTIISGYRW